LPKKHFRSIKTSFHQHQQEKALRTIVNFDDLPSTLETYRQSQKATPILSRPFSATFPWLFDSFDKSTPTYLPFASNITAFIVSLLLTVDGVFLGAPFHERILIDTQS
jgi:hypothetical protein